VLHLVQVQQDLLDLQETRVQLVQLVQQDLQELVTLEQLVLQAEPEQLVLQVEPEQLVQLAELAPPELLDLQVLHHLYLGQLVQQVLLVSQDRLVLV
jgi:hypothetical protein